MLKRLKNLWKLSELEVPELAEKTTDNPKGTITTIIPFLKKRKKMATIVEDSPLEEFEEEKEI